jgi:hypothetical protein
MNRSLRLANLGAAGILAAALLVVGCKVDKAAFQERLFTCNPTAADPACGTDGDDKPMACVPAYQLGGSNFCATGCDATSDPVETADGLCLPSGPRTAGAVSGARLPRCNPAEAANTCGTEAMSCLRTDLVSDEGVCMTVGSCATDMDCRDPIRSKCMGTLLRETYSHAALKSDHTYCLQAECRARRTACSPGETCMRDILPRTSNPPDICVPHCDANGNCPPNYFCYPNLYGKRAPRVCIPGLLGLRCQSKLDCLFGDCVETGAPYKVCSVACNSNADCEKYDSIQGTFFCNPAGQCMTARGFKGGVCERDDDCTYPNEICGHITNTMQLGLCMQACGEGGSCPAPGGVPHACRPQLDAAGKLALTGPPWVCWPGYFGQLCMNDSQCFPGLACQQLDPSNALARICTLPCKVDEDCDANNLTREGWCDAQTGACRSPLADGAACERKRQCESGGCTVPSGGAADGTKKCDATPGY